MRVLIIDEYASREYKEFLEEHFSDIEVVGTCGIPRKGAEILRHQYVDVVLMYLNTSSLMKNVDFSHALGGPPLLVLLTNDIEIDRADYLCYDYNIIVDILIRPPMLEDFIAAFRKARALLDPEYRREQLFDESYFCLN